MGFHKELGLQNCHQILWLDSSKTLDQPEQAADIRLDKAYNLTDTNLILETKFQTSTNVIFSRAPRGILSDSLWGTEICKGKEILLYMTLFTM